MDKYEKAIREKIFDSRILTRGEWVYLVGTLLSAKEIDGAAREIDRLCAIIASREDSLGERIGEVKRLRAALEEISDLADVSADQAATMARAALDVG